MFSKERSSLAGLYAWRADHPANPTDRQSMEDAADFAFRQFWALCPYSPEAVFRYVAFLMEEKKAADALAVEETAAKFRSAAQEEQFDQLVANLKRYAAAK